jgi:NTE family protein
MTEQMSQQDGRVAIVLSGAGARGAYEAGALSVLLPLLKEADQPRIVIGTSAGALNTAMLVSVLDQGVDPATALLDGWGQIAPEKVFATPRRSLLRLAMRRFRRPDGTAPGLLDTGPLRDTLGEMLADEHFADGVNEGPVDTVGIVASSCATGSATVFLQTHPRVPVPRSGPGVAYVRTRLGFDHLMASSAFPLAFPAQWVEGDGGGWHIDGGVHLNTPFKPAIDLGADRVLVIGATPWKIDQQPERSLPTNVMDGGGQLLHALLVDSLRADITSLRRFNSQLLNGAGGATSGAATAVAGGSGRSAAASGHRVVQFCPLNPSNDDLSDLAARIWPSGMLRFSRSLGGYRALGPVTGQRQRPGQFLSYLCFDQAFISEAIALGQADARRLVGSAGRIPWET